MQAGREDSGRSSNRKRSGSIVKVEIETLTELGLDWGHTGNSVPPAGCLALSEDSLRHGFFDDTDRGIV